jgi:uncharacterized membrane protein YhaH (DUF805 family)
MDWTWYLFGFKGRLTRARFWLAGLVVLSLMIAFVALVQFALSVNFVAQALGTAAGGGKLSFAISFDDIFVVFDPEAWRALSFEKLLMLLVRAIALALFLWIFLATSIKRLHDRDKSAWWMLPFFAAPQLYKHFWDQLPDSNFMMIPDAIMLVLMIWGFVELYFLRGTKWTNRYGPDPLGKEQMRVRSERARLRATTAWSQDSEIELVPHKAGPPPAMRVNRGHD